MQALRKGQADALIQASEFKNELDIEKDMHTKTKSELSTSQQEASTLRQAEAHARAQADEIETALNIERRINTHTETYLAEEATSLRHAEADARAQAGELKKSLDIERQMHTKTKFDLSASRQEASAHFEGKSQAINDRSMMRRKMKDKQAMLEEELTKAKETAATARQGQMKAVSELNKSMRLNQGSDQSTDTQLVQKLVELRNDIRTWSLTYFITTSENASKLSRHDLMKILDKTKVHSFTRENFFERSLQDPTIRPTVVRSILWKVLQCGIFRQYLWVMGPFMSRSVKDTHNFLSFHMVKKHTQDSNEKSHKFNIWRANGSAMFSQAPDPDQKRTNRDQIITKWVATIIVLLKPLFANQDQKDVEDDLYQIIDQALALDEELCQQVADVSVQYLRDSAGLVKLRFDSDAMTTEIGSKDATAGDAVSAILAPALVKRGNSAGNQFDKQILLVPMEVICQPAEPKPTSRANPILVQDPTPSPKV
ncbi:unnamed protein product [Clonostachys byssicola]|uniref:Uncharacterized protein n=1 Tax=Clonostachys byssicola TaxID=160290 RepID=A0A9N9Y159_9HYPO|nr:unnamed protein product [Clonostachys byssicola]